MADKYSKFGPAPRTPSCMQRSYLLSIDFKVTSLTEWAAKVKKPKTKGTKADSVEKVTVADLLPTLEKTDFKLDEQPYSSLFKIYQRKF